MNNNNHTREQHLARLARTIRRRADLDDFRQANAKKRRPFLGDAISLDSSSQRPQGDNGASAKKIRAAGENPKWLVEFNRVINHLDGMDKRIVDALFTTLCPTDVAHLVGTNRQRVYRTINRLRGPLARAYALWRRERD